MKRVLLFAAVAVAVTATSCKKEYECCWYEDGEKLDEWLGTSLCTTQELKKSEVKDIEDAADGSLYPDGWEYKCEEN